MAKMRMRKYLKVQARQLTHNQKFSWKYRQLHSKDTILKIWNKYLEKELRGLSPNFHIHVWSIYIFPTISLPILLHENMWADPGNI